MRRSTVFLFLALEAALYTAFLTMDLTGLGADSIWLKYAGILLCVLVSCGAALRSGDCLVPPALALTALADLFLLVLNRHYGIGVAIFLGVQILYLIRLRRAGACPALWLRGALALALGLAVCWTGLATPLNLLCCLYFSQLLSNACLAWTLRGRSWRRFALGLTLFVGCDVCVGIFNLPGLLPDALYQFARVGMWLFYLPSQVLITASAFPVKESS